MGGGRASAKKGGTFFLTGPLLCYSIPPRSHNPPTTNTQATKPDCILSENTHAHISDIVLLNITSDKRDNGDAKAWRAQ